MSIGSRQRRVELHDGELFVTVRHDAARPFSVGAGGLDVTATGTAFNVARAQERTIVTVTDGSVDARHEGQSSAEPGVRMRSGEQLVYSRASRSVMLRQADPHYATSWRSGTLHFQNEVLSEVIAVVNRYAPAAIMIEDPQVSALSFTGTARIDRIQGWLQALPLVFPVTVVQLADGRQLISARPEVRPD